MATLPMSMDQLHLTMVDTVNVQLEDATRQESFLYDIATKAPCNNGQGHQWTVKTANNTSIGTRTVGEDIGAAGATTKVNAEQATGTYYGSFGLDNKQIAEYDLSTSLGQNRVMDLLDSEINDVVQGIASDLSEDMIAGTGPAAANTILGLCATNGIIDDAGSIYGGVNRSTYTQFQAKVYDNSATPRALTLAIIEAAVDNYINTITRVSNWVAGGWAILTGTAQATVMRGFTGADTPMRAVTDNETTLKILGYADMSFRGQIPVITVPGYTTGRIDFVKLSELTVRYTPQNDEFGTSGSTPFILKRPQLDGPRVTWMVEAYPALVLPNPRMQSFSIQDLS